MIFDLGFVGKCFIAGLAIAGGTYLLIKDKIVVELGEDTGKFRTISGYKAKICSLVLIASGIFMLFNFMAGFIMFLATGVLLLVIGN